MDATRIQWDFLDCPDLLAQEVLAHHGDLSLPVPVVGIAASKGATVRYVPLASDGALTRTRSGYLIHVNYTSPLSRKRFTVAHEIGHILCDELSGTYPGTRYRSSNPPIAIQQEERFCQRFAAYLLIPDETIAEFTAWESLSIVKLQAKARELQVSAPALLWRVLERLPYEGGAILFRIMSKPTDPSDLKLRVDWDVFPNTPKRYIPQFDAVPALSPIHHALTHNQEVLYRDVKMDFGSLRGTKNLLVKSSNGKVLAIVLPPEVDPNVFRCGFQIAAF
jgi:hypothetical protein